MDSIPFEIILIIFEYLDDFDYTLCMLVCKLWKEIVDERFSHELISNEYLWKYVVKRDYFTLLQWLYDQGVPWEGFTCEYASKRDCLHMAIFLMDKHCPPKKINKHCGSCSDKISPGVYGLCDTCSNDKYDVFCISCLEPCNICSTNGCRECNSVKRCDICCGHYCEQCMGGDGCCQTCGDCYFCDYCLEDGQCEYCYGVSRGERN
jgi:hypothetical protein